MTDGSLSSAVATYSVTRFDAIGEIEDLHFGELRNLVSGRRLGASQVTAVVTRELEAAAAKAATYIVALRATLVEPYFLRLASPEVITRAPLDQLAA
jgi:hypothetical protein